MVHNVGLSNLEVSASNSKSSVSVSLERILEEMPKTARRLAQANAKAYKQEMAAQQIMKRQQKVSTGTHKDLLLHLTGGRTMSDAVMVESAAKQVVNGGVPCVPVTLEWAKWLSANASEISAGLQSISTDYSKTSSSTTTSFGTEIQAITKKISSFIGVMESYSTPAGIARLKLQIESFEKSALHDVLAVVEKTIVSLVKKGLSSVLGKHPSFLQEAALNDKTAMKTEAGSHQRARQILALVSAESERRQAQKELEGSELSPV